MYYLLIVVATVMLSGSFALKDSYRKLCGNDFSAVLYFTFTGGIVGLAVLLLFNRSVFSFTPFTIFMALLSATNNLLFSFFAFKALGRTNLSVYSLFSMSGGMLLPFFTGIFFYGEPFTSAKGVCLAFMFSAFIITIKKGKDIGEIKYYAGVFFSNGASGVLNKIFTASRLPKGSVSEYSILSAVITVVLSFLLIKIIYGKNKNSVKRTFLSRTICVCSGSINKIANWLLVIALLEVPASVQYPMVTGGVMIVSTLIGFSGKNKPKIKEVIAVSLAFTGLLCLFLMRFN